MWGSLLTWMPYIIGNILITTVPFFNDMPVMLATLSGVYVEFIVAFTIIILHIFWKWLNDDEKEV
jgi:hypothetical protein